MVALVLLVVGWAGGAWAQDAGSTDVVELTKPNGEVVGTYSDLTTASDNISEDGMILKMVTDFNFPDVVTIKNGKAITLDLNGHHLSFTKDFLLQSASKLTIVDKSGAGHFDFYFEETLVVEQNCELNIIGGNYFFYYPIYVKDNATLNIYGGNFQSSNNAVANYYVIEDNHVGENAKINIYGGHYSRVNDIMRSKVAQNYIMNDDSGTEETYKYSVSPNENQLIQIIKSNGVIVGTYDKINTAIDAITEDGLTLKIIKDINGRNEEEGFTFSKGKSVTLDLNGHTLDYSTYLGQLIVAGSGEGRTNKLTIVDNNTGKGTVKFNYYSIFIAQYNSEINIEGGTYEMNRCKLQSNNNSKLNIYNGYFKNSNDANLIDEYSYGITIYGGHFHVSDVSIQKHAADGYTLHKQNDSEGTNEYPYYIDTYVTELTYGDGTIDAQKEISDNFSIDLKDEGNLSASLSRIKVRSDIENVDVTVKKNFANTKWQAFYAPFQIDVTSELSQSFEVAKIWDTELDFNDNSTLIEFKQLKEGESIPAFTPCLIKAKATGKQDIVFKNVTVKATNTTAEPIECSNVDERFTFTGVLENTSITDLYALDSETGNLVQASSETAKVTPMKFFMTVESKTPVTSIKSKRFAVRVIGDETTGISDINSEASARADGAVYNMQGVKMGTSLNGLPAGLYIVNGRKVAVK